MNLQVWDVQAASSRVEAEAGPSAGAEARCPIGQLPKLSGYIPKLVILVPKSFVVSYFYRDSSVKHLKDCNFVTAQTPQTSY